MSITKAELSDSSHLEFEFKRFNSTLHLSSQLRQFLVHTGPCSQLVLQVLRYTTQFILVHFLQQVELEIEEDNVS